MPPRNFVCSVCKHRRHKCSQDCVFAPYFPRDQPLKFINVQKFFTKVKLEKILKSLDTTQRGDAATAISYEADARVHDPVYGCVGYIPILVHEIQQAQIDLYNTRKQFAKAKAMIPILSQEIKKALIDLYHTKELLAIAKAGGVLAHCPPLFCDAQKQRVPRSVDASGFNQISAAAMSPYQIQRQPKQEHDEYLYQNQEQPKQQHDEHLYQNQEQLKQQHDEHLYQNQEQLKQQHDEHLYQNQEQLKQQHDEHLYQNQEQLKQQHDEHLYQNQEQSKQQHDEHLLDRLKEIMGTSGMERMLQCHLGFIQQGRRYQHLVQPEFQQPPVQPQQQQQQWSKEPRKAQPEFHRPSVQPQQQQQQRPEEPRDARTPSSTGSS